MAVSRSWQRVANKRSDRNIFFDKSISGAHVDRRCCCFFFAGSMGEPRSRSDHIRVPWFPPTSTPEWSASERAAIKVLAYRALSSATKIQRRFYVIIKQFPPFGIPAVLQIY